MNEKPIRQNTIVSTTDKRLSLLQWLKTLDKNVTELQENGVDMNLLVFNSVQEFYEYFKTKYLGKTCELPYLLRHTATPDEASGNNVDYYIYVYGNTYFNIDGDYIEIFVNGPVFQYEYISDDCEFCIGASISLYLQNNGTYGLDSVNPATNWYPRYAVDYNEMNGAITTAINNLKTEIDPNIKALYTELASYLKAVNASKTEKAYGFLQILKDRTSVLVGIAWKENTDDNTHRHFYGFVAKNDDIYYSTGVGILNVSTGEIENAVSGTELKEAVRLANQKTYWHTINLHNSGTLSDVHITIVIPSHSSTPVANVQDLLAIGAGDTWGCSGTIATTESSLPIVTFDGVKFGATADATIFSGTLGRTYTLTQLIAKSLEYNDNVKEVK